MALKVKCSNCFYRIEIDEYMEVEDILFCPECDTEFEILSLNPPKIKSLAYDDDDEEYSEYADADES